MLSTLLGSFTIYADAPAEDVKSEGEGVEASADGSTDKAGTEAAEVEEAEEEEAEDIHPTLRDECSDSAKCVGFKKHFEHCQEKVQAGEGFKGEDCVEEMCMF